MANVILGGLAFAVGLYAGYAEIGPRLAAKVGDLNPSVAPSAVPGSPAAGMPTASAAPKPVEERPRPPAPIRTGYVDKNGTLAIEPQYVQARAFKDGVAAVVVDGKWGFIDPRGALVIPATLFDTDDFSEGLALVRNEQRKCGYIDHAGKLVLDFEYDMAWPFRNGVAIVGVGPQDERQYYIIRKNGDKVTRLGWPPIGNLSEGVAPLRVSDTQIGFFDKTGRVMVKLRLDEVRDFTDGMALVTLHGKLGAMNHEWRVVIAPMFGAMMDFSEGVAPAASEARFGFVDKKGAWVIEPVHESVGRFSEGLALFSLEGRFGFLDHAGKEVIEPKFEEASAFHHGLAAAKLGGKSGYIDPKGNWAIEPRFLGARDFGEEGLAPVLLPAEKLAASGSPDEADPQAAERDR